jgi:predicted nucleic acid-binding protein
VKRYVREAGSDAVQGWLASGTPATSRLSEVEVASALMRRWREGAFDKRGRDRALAALGRDFKRLSVVEIGPLVTARVVALLERHALRAGDALQLASSLLLRDSSTTPVTFAAFDDRLNQAARAERLEPPR